MTVEEALTGSRTLLVEALLADGCVSEPATAQKLADDLLREQKEHVPNFT